MQDVAGRDHGRCGQLRHLPVAGADDDAAAAAARPAGRRELVHFGSFGDYAERLVRDPSPVNTYALIGHMSLRVEAMNGDTQRAATDREAAQMQRAAGQALAEGASGFSTGLYYPPNMMAPTDEVIAVAEALRAAGGLYVTHMRDEASEVLLPSRRR